MAKKTVPPPAKKQKKSEPTLKDSYQSAKLSTAFKGTSTGLNVRCHL